MKKILFDLTGWQTSGTRGIGRYTINLALALIRSNSLNISFIYSNHWQLHNLPKELFSHKIISYDEKLTENFDYLILSDPIDHDITGLQNVISSCKTITCIFYDLIPLIFAKDYLSNTQSRLDYVKHLATLNIIDHFFCISKCTEHDLHTYLNIPENKTSCIYGGADTSKFKLAHAKTKRHDIVMIPGDDLRKNYVRACEAFAKSYTQKLIPSDSRLRIICKHGNQFKENIKNCLANYPNVKLGKEIILDGYVEDEILVDAVTSATSTIFPSLYEGLGLPIIESLAAGTPCISSNNSSCAELNIPECQFNPRSVDDISRKINEIFNSKTLRQKCLNFGKNLIGECSWEKTAKKVIKTIHDFNKIKPNSIAMFGCYPPSASGIATYNKLISNNAKNCIDFFSDDKSVLLQYYSSKNNLLNSNIFPISSYQDLLSLKNYITHVFVLGNSLHNVIALDAAISIHSKTNSWLYIHDGELESLIKPYCKKENLDTKTLYFTVYGDRKPHYGIRVVQKLTGIKNFIVNTRKCEAIINKELSDINNIRIVKLFLPIKNRLDQKDFAPSNSIITSLQKIKQSGNILIGTFGLPDDKFKSTNIIIEAIKQVKSKYPKIVLILAGYNVKNYMAINSHLRISDFVAPFDAPTDDDLSYLMSQIDIGIQLRPNSNGEASGTISELVCYNKRLIVTDNFTNGYDSNLFTQVPPLINAADLAKVIISCINNLNIKVDKQNLSKYSLKKFIKEFIVRTTPANSNLTTNFQIKPFIDKN